LLKDERVLELGCGLGLTGLVAADTAVCCLLNDSDKKVIDHLKDRLIKNNKASKVKASLLDWREDKDMDANGKVDLIIAAGVAYYLYLLRPLF
jgi:cyclopropane fatty-acyl-phospholipid synthase-like methyltransferase